MLRASVVGLVLALWVVGGCEQGGTSDPDSGADGGGGPADAGETDGGALDGGGVDGAALDGAALDGAALDGAALDGAALDGAAPDGAALDGGAVDGGELDAGALDAAASTSCEAAGGTCVAVVPSACPTGIFGNPDWYSCGGGLGVSCCLPRTTPPACRAIGTRSEGWYRADGTRICYATCAGASVACEAVGTRSEGWYSDIASASCSTPPVARLVEWADCSP